MSIKPGDYVQILKRNENLRWSQVEGEPTGVVESILHRHQDGSYTHLLRIPAGTVIPDPVVHDFYEEALYVEGEMLNTKTGETITGGMYVFHSPGEEHGPFRCVRDCLLVEFRYYK